MNHSILNEATFVAKKMDKKEFCVLIKYCFFKGKNTVEAKNWLGVEFSDTVPEEPTIKDWYAKFRCDEISTEDDKRSGPPKEIVADENIKKSTE